MKTPAQRRGSDAERRALRELEAHGLRLICRNFRCRFGELDLVLADGTTLVVAEVRYRSAPRAGGGYGGAATSIGWAKRRRISAATSVFLSRHRRFQRWPVRFDVVAIDAERVQWIAGAFDAVT